jgi:hypothetical protein
VILFVASLMLSGFTTGMAADSVVSSPGPILTSAGVVHATPGMLTVVGNHFTPGGPIYLVLFDHAGAKLDSSVWTRGVVTRFDENGNYAYDGVLHETLGAVCGAAAMVQAYDEQAATWSNLLFIDKDSGKCGMSPPDGRRRAA